MLHMTRSMLLRVAGCAMVSLLAGAPAFAQPSAQPTESLAGLDAIYPALSTLYIDLHKTPELSLFEEKTSAKMAEQLRKLGYEVTEKVGGYGVVGILRNGEGPTVLFRADMDALPVKEQTGAAHASTVTMKNWSGEIVPVMHACGHDVHMVSLIGAATLLAQQKDRWHGTLVMIAQPAEEGFSGAKSMVKAGLFDRIPKPDFCLGIHVDNQLPAGDVGVTPGAAMAASDSIDITVYGRGGHGSTPHRTTDPIVIAARIVDGLQTIVSREVDPQDTAVVTVGTFHAGTKRNIIPDEAKLELTVRTFKPETRKQVIDSVMRIAKAEALAGGATREPLIDYRPNEGYDVVTNDPELSERLAGTLRKAIGTDHVKKTDPLMGSEDFGVFGVTVGAPSIQLRIGATNAALFADAKAKGRSLLLPGLHSSNFLPDQEPTIRTGVAAFTLSALELLSKPAGTPAPK